MFKLKYLPTWRDATGDSILLVMCEHCGMPIEKLEDGLVLCRFSKNADHEHLNPSDLVGTDIHIVHSSRCDAEFVSNPAWNRKTADWDWMGLDLDKMWPFK